MQPPRLALCRACNQFVKREDVVGDCPHCGVNVIEAAMNWVEARQRAEAAIAQMEAALLQMADAEAV